MSRIWLVGLMGAGKTAVGERVAAILGVPFTDTDRLVEQTAGSSVARIWEEEGEAGFRELEAKVLSGLGDATGIIAAGGGAVLDPTNRDVITGVVVWLDASPETLARRVGERAEERPLLGAADPGTRLAKLAEKRRPAYLAVSTHRIVTDHLALDEVAAEVVRLWPA